MVLSEILMIISLASFAVVFAVWVAFFLWWFREAGRPYPCELRGEKLRWWQGWFWFGGRP